MIYVRVAGTGWEKPPPSSAFKGLFAARGTAASAATRSMLHAGFNLPGKTAMNPSKSWAERVSCGSRLQEKHWLEKFWSDAPVSCTCTSRTAGLRGAKLKSMRRAGISFVSTLIWLHWENGLIPISHHCVFQQKDRICRLCSCYESPFGRMVPRSKRWNKD